MSLSLSSIEIEKLPKFPIIGNHEFIALFLAKNGPTQPRELKKAFNKWKGVPEDSRTNHEYFAWQSDRHYRKARCMTGISPDANTYWWRPYYYIATNSPNRPYNKVDKNLRKVGYQLTARGLSLAASTIAKLDAYEHNGPPVPKKKVILEERVWKVGQRVKLFRQNSYRSDAGCGVIISMKYVMTNRITNEVIESIDINKFSYFDQDTGKYRPNFIHVKMDTGEIVFIKSIVDLCFSPRHTYGGWPADTYRRYRAAQQQLRLLGSDNEKVKHEKSNSCS